ncbi:prepilin peptidase [Acetobacter sacchari]|uniref:Prepilin leader peptidase/N-methyltransferase n=1 Tax=Acetobacter sacchari TaxID=2661687 RepID=A0ABS3LVG3_9PROT|nr:A24 family peptidase [Acetobacter sacchari]MBO1359903.1 prepilin peptidase [Acetobacter sacchari]
MPDPVLCIPFLIAPFIGSFLGVLIRRIPRGEPFAASRSHCETCQTKLGARDLAPILSWLVQKGRCRHCGANVDPQHLHIELAAFLPPMSALVGYAVLHRTDPLGQWSIDPVTFWFECVLGWMLLALAWIDVICLRLPDVLTLPLLIVGLFEAILSGDVDVAGDRALAAGLGWTGLLLLGVTYRRLRGRIGLGGGDAKLLGAAGAWVGCSHLSLVLLLASCFGLLAALGAIFRGGRVSAAMMLPFGPSLAAAIWIVRLAL